MYFFKVFFIFDFFNRHRASHLLLILIISLFTDLGLLTAQFSRSLTRFHWLLEKLSFGGWYRLVFSLLTFKCFRLILRPCARREIIGVIAGREVRIPSDIAVLESLQFVCIPFELIMGRLSWLECFYNPSDLLILLLLFGDLLLRHLLHPRQARV